MWGLKKGLLNDFYAAIDKILKIDPKNAAALHVKDIRAKLQNSLPPNPELEKQFIADATAAGLKELKGHRSVGGMRASIYNAMPLEGVQALVAWMREFEKAHG